jgi:hypothetical protein
LTNWLTGNKPAIADGSVIEIDGAIFEAQADEVIPNPSGLTTGRIFIKITPNGNAATAKFVNDTPVWDNGKQGWYSIKPYEGNCRYLPFDMDYPLYTAKNKRLFGNGYKCPDIRLLIGTVNHAAGIETVGWTQGFDQNNTHVISCKIDTLNWQGPPGYAGYDASPIYVSMYAGGIKIKHGNTFGITEKNYQLLIMKI